MHIYIQSINTNQLGDQESSTRCCFSNTMMFQHSLSRLLNIYWHHFQIHNLWNLFDTPLLGIGLQGPIILIPTRGKIDLTRTRSRSDDLVDPLRCDARTALLYVVWHVSPLSVVPRLWPARPWSITQLSLSQYRTRDKKVPRTMDVRTQMSILADNTTFHTTNYDHLWPDSGQTW